MKTDRVPSLAKNETLDRTQAGFYRRWLNAWKRGEILDVEGQYQYIWQYLKSLRLDLPYDELLLDLLRLRDIYSTSSDSSLAFYLSLWATDCYILLHRYEEAISVFPNIQVNSRASVNTDCLLSLKFAIGGHVSGKDAITLFGAQLTSFGKKHVDQASEYLDVLISAYERENNVNLLQNWSTTSSNHNYGVFRGSHYGYTATQTINLIAYNFSLNSEVEQFIKSRTRDAENTIREEQGIPHVGEGWVSEMELYYAINKSLPDLEVIHHGSPDWLSKQHLDIYIPEIRLAIEFQGLQHDEPVAFFGGQEAFAQSQVRDARKKKLCDQHEVQLLYVRPSYVLQDTLTLINNRIAEVLH